MRYELAEVNIARLAAPLESIQLADFMAALDPINALADEAPGFCWRLQTDDGNATAVEGFSGDIGDGVGVITNLTTWTDMRSLVDFVYGPMHAAIMRRRREWFIPFTQAYTVCWWVPAGHRPPVSEAEDRLAHLRQHGPTAHAFTIKRHFPPPGAIDSDVAIDSERDLCGV